MQLANSIIPEVQEAAHKAEFDGDELAHTAAMVIENLKHETNPKFQNSQFMGLMRQLRDGEVVVEGDRVVENDGRMRNSSQIEIATDVKGKGKERAQLPLDPSSSIVSREVAIACGFLPTFNSYLCQFYQRSLQQQQQQRQSQESEESELDAFLRQENADYTMYWQEFNRRPVSETMSHTAQAREWETLQEDWDRFEATSAGIKQLNNYQFQENNPYLLGNSSKTRHHAMHTGTLSTLEVCIFLLKAAALTSFMNSRVYWSLKLLFRGI